VLNCYSRNNPIGSRLNFAAARSSAFTFVEVIMGITILGLAAGAMIFGLNQLNYYATVNRLYTAAQTLAQNHIDLILTKGPFDPTKNKYPLLNGTDSSTNILRTDTNYFYDPSTPTQLYPKTTYPNGKQVTLYKDPMNGNAIVQGTIEVSVCNPSPAFTVNGNTLEMRQASVTVSYTFRRQTYSVVMNTMRSAE
jgi:type II secretory pathway pseudopilin PulG